MHPSRGALSGLQIVEIGNLASEYCGKLLEDMGANVVRLARSVPDISLLHQTAADVFIDSAPDLHLDHHALCAVNPRLIIAAIRPFGGSGPYRDYRGSDLVCQAAGGMVYVNGERDEPPLQGAGVPAYQAAAMHAAIGIMLALIARQDSGRGQVIDVSIQECVAACVEPVSSCFFEDGTITQRQGTLHWTRHFRQTRCNDGFALLSSLGDWTTLVEWVKADGKAEDLIDPRWHDIDYRREHCDHLFDVLDRWAAGYSVATLVEAAQLRRLPFAAVEQIESLATNPQLLARNFFVTDKQEILPGAPYRFSQTPWKLGRQFFGKHGADAVGPAAPATMESQHSAKRPVQRALNGIRVIDFTWVVAGPLATRILADHGADVIKVEPLAADVANRRGGLFGNLNRGKRSIAINMNDERGLSIAKRLIASADVVIDNFSPRVMPQWGLDYEGLQKLRPDIIAVSMSAFGQTGPWRDYVSYGPTLQAMSGFSWLMRHDGGAPAGWGFSYSDMAAGCMAALATLFALWHRRYSGKGQLIDLSQFECLISLLGPNLPRASGPYPPDTATAIDNRSQEMPSAPHGVYRCADRTESFPRDRWCAIAVFDEVDWQCFCAALGDPAWTRDTDFRTLDGRIQYRDRLDARVESWTRELAAEDVMTLLQGHGVAAAVVADARDLCAENLHMRSRDYFKTMTTPEGTTVRLDGSPIHLSETPPQIVSPAPLLGEDTDAVLMESLGMTKTEIAASREAKVVA